MNIKLKIFLVGLLPLIPIVLLNYFKEIAYIIVGISFVALLLLTTYVLGFLILLAYYGITKNYEAQEMMYNDLICSIFKLSIDEKIRKLRRKCFKK